MHTDRIEQHVVPLGVEPPALQPMRRRRRDGRLRPVRVAQLAVPARRGPQARVPAPAFVRVAFAPRGGGAGRIAAVAAGGGGEAGEEVEGEGPQGGEAGGDDATGGLDGGPDDGAVHGPGEVRVADFELFGEADEAGDDDARGGCFSAGDDAERGDGRGWRLLTSRPAGK